MRRLIRTIPAPIRNVLRKHLVDARHYASVPKRTYLGLTARPIRTVVDVGANKGQFAQRALKAFPQARLFCFEPVPAAVEVLEAWAAGEANRVEVLPIAVGEEPGTVEMFHHLDHDPASSLLPTTAFNDDLYPQTRRQQAIEVAIRTLDEALAPFGLEDEILVKMDVQGFEDRVIRGGPKTFARAAACILEVSLDTLYEGQATFQDLNAALDAHGFRYAGNLSQEIAADGHVIFIDAVYVR